MNKRATFTQAEVFRALKAAKAAGFDAARVEIGEGKIVLVAGNGQSIESDADLDKWMARHADKA